MSQLTEVVTKENMNRRQLYKMYRSPAFGMSKYSAALTAGYPMSLASRNSTPPVPTDFVSLFEQKKITNVEKVNKIIEGINATKTIPGRGGHSVEVPDWPAKYKYTELMLKLCKQLDDRKDDSSPVKDIAMLIKAARERVNEGLLAMESRIIVKEAEEVIDV